MAAADLGTTILGIVWTLTVLATLFLGLRLYVKLTTVRKLYWDDFILVASWVMLLGFSSAATYGINYGKGIHSASLKFAESAAELQLTVIVATVFSVLGAAWSKTSFAITLLRLTKGKIRHLVWFVIVSMNLVLTFHVILQFLWCRPASGAWRGGPPGTCWSPDVIMYYSMTAAAYSAATDVLLAMVPWVVIMGLKMQMKERIGVAVCMSLGVIAAMTSIMRAVHIPSLYHSDSSWDESQLFIWTAAELSTTIIATSIPVLRPLLRNMVNSTQRRKDDETTNTFKMGTYVRSSISRSQNYRRMEGDGASQAPRQGGQLGGIDEDVESLSSLVPTPKVGMDHELKHGGIMKTEEIQVEYDIDSKSAWKHGYNFKVEALSPIHPSSRL